MNFKRGLTTEKLRAVVNLFVTYFNMFVPQQEAANLLFFLVDKHHHVMLKTFLVFLDRCPETVEYDEQTYSTAAIECDEILLDKLRRL